MGGGDIAYDARDVRPNRWIRTIHCRLNAAIH